MKQITQFAAGFALLGVVATSAQAQYSSSSDANMANSAGSFSVEPYLSHTFGNDFDGIRGGFGARLMYGVASTRGGYFTRPQLGVFGTYTTDSKSASAGGISIDAKTKTFNYGAEGDLMLFGSAINNVLDPFISLGAGIFHSSTDVSVSGSSESNSQNKFALAPGIGTMFTIQQGMSIGVRGDIRFPIVFGIDDGNGNSRTAKGTNFQLGLNFKF